MVAPCHADLCHYGLLHARTPAQRSTSKPAGVARSAPAISNLDLFSPRPELVCCSRLITLAEPLRTIAGCADVEAGIHMKYEAKERQTHNILVRVF
ncbi:hypothetical protein ZWY2020_056755 [Hordeum vulgare]|nr:hypothetical protein ZWY2020_030294 [Hordeum vulgare]KAI5015365.1 hypothetical protein ZWY2020_056755 [Hordeum vulgare]